MVFKVVLTNVGGNGGRGGDVILECAPSVWDFRSLQHHLVCYSHLFVIVNNKLACQSSIEVIDSYAVLQRAGKGGHGAPKNMIGTCGEDKVLFGCSLYLQAADGVIAFIIRPFN